PYAPPPGPPGEALPQDADDGIPDLLGCDRVPEATLLVQDTRCDTGLRLRHSARLSQRTSTEQSWLRAPQTKSRMSWRCNDPSSFAKSGPGAVMNTAVVI